MTVEKDLENQTPPSERLQQKESVVQGLITHAAFSIWDEFWNGNHEFDKYRKSEFSMTTYLTFNVFMMIYLALLLFSILIYFPHGIRTDLSIVWFSITLIVAIILLCLVCTHKCFIQTYSAKYTPQRYNRILGIISKLENLYFLFLCSSYNLHIYLFSVIPSRRSDFSNYAHADRSGHLPEHMVFAGLLASSLGYLILRHVRFRTILAGVVFTVICSIVIMCCFSLYKSILVVITASLMCLFVLYEVHRQTWASFIITAKLQEYIVENARMAEQIRQNEMGHMIGNVAHDLKTPLSSFVNGVEMIETIIEELRLQALKLPIIDKAMYDPATVDRDLVFGKLNTMTEVAENILNINTFMMMTINRCIDYKKTMHGIKLSPTLETIPLLDTLNSTIKCVTDLQNEREIKLLPIPVTVATYISTDKQWLSENMLCLLSNAVKYSKESDKIITIQISIIRGNDRLLIRTNSMNSMTSFSGKHLIVKNGNNYCSVSNRPESGLDQLEEHSYECTPSAENFCHLETKKKPKTLYPEPIASTSSFKFRLINQILFTSPSKKYAKILLNHPDSSNVNNERESHSESASKKGQKTESKSISSNNSNRSNQNVKNLLNSKSNNQNTSNSQLSIALNSYSGGHEVYGNSGDIPSSRTLQTVDYLLFEIEDSGPGINSLEEMQNLFYPSIQANRFTGGTGLGLYSLARRVEALDGFYGVKQRKDGDHGACFWFALPYLPQKSSALMGTGSPMPPASPGPASARKVIESSQQHQQQQQSNSQPLILESGEQRLNIPSTIQSASSHTEPGQQHVPAIPIPAHVIPTSISQSFDDFYSHIPKLKILVVDDSMVILKMASQLLQRNGHTVVTASNGLESVEKVKAAFQTTPIQPFDVVLMDFQMPVMDGLEAIKQIREFEHTLVVFPEDLDHSHASNIASISGSSHKLEIGVIVEHSNTSSQPGTPKEQSKSQQDDYQSRKFANSRKKEQFTSSFYGSINTTELANDSQATTTSEENEPGKNQEVPVVPQVDSSPEIVHESPIFSKAVSKRIISGNEDMEVIDSIENPPHPHTKHSTHSHKMSKKHAASSTKNLLPAAFQDSLQTIRSSVGNFTKVRHILIGFSAKSDAESIQTGFDYGMDDFMSKPFTLKTFYEIYSKIKAKEMLYAAHQPSQNFYQTEKQ